ncbi:MAG: hypothetical protein FIA98_04465, partial [Anaerolineae bacterium]|nr:hypothetical protein [Anaerolineae bacterium]
MDSSTLLVIAGFFFFLGAGIVGLIWIIVALIRSIRRKSAAGVARDSNLVVITSLMRDNTTKELVVEMEGKTYKTVEELAPSQLRRLSFTSNVLVKWLALSQATDSQATANDAATLLSDSTEPDINPALAESSWQMEEADTSEPVVPPFSLSEPGQLEQPLPVAPIVAAIELPEPTAKPIPELNDWIPAETLPDQSQSPRVPPFFYEPEPEVKPVSTQLPDLVSGILMPAPAPAPVVKSIATQINDILQGMITETSFEKRGLTVNDGPGHG